MRILSPTPAHSTAPLLLLRASPLSGRLRALFTLLLALLLHSNAWAQGDRTADRTLSPYFHVEGGDNGVDSLPLLGTQVEIAITGVIAEVTVTQTYENAGATPIHARYVFPASTRAAVHGLRMKLGERVIRAKIREREQARAEFEAAKEAGKTASLLEQDRPNVFSMGLSNILPGDRLEVTLDYTELLVPEAGTYEFVFPTVVGPRYSNHPATGADPADRFIQSPYLAPNQKPQHTLDIQGTVTAGFPIDRAAIDSHQTTLGWDDPSTLRFQLEAGERQSRGRDFILRYRLAGDALQTGLSLYERGNEKFFLAMVQAPKRITPEQIPPREFVFILDVSGSMHGFPIDTAKVLLGDLVGNLRPEDTFNLLFFSGGSWLMAPASLPATETHLTAALGALEQIDGSGGTELLPALRRALALPTDRTRSRSFVVITDGYIGSEAEMFDTVRAHLGDANVYAFGIGSSVNRFLVEGIAKAGLAEPFIVTDPSLAPAAAAKLREYISAPVLTRVSVGFEGFDAYAVTPRSIPDLLADRPLVIHGKWRGEAKGAVVVRGLSGAAPFEARLDASQAPSRPEHRALPYLWARTRIANLTDFAGEQLSERDRREVVSLGLHYNLLTRYTSFIAVAEPIRNPGGGATSVAQPQALPAGVSALAIGEGVIGADEPELALVLGFFLFLAGAAGLWRRRIPGTVR